MDSITPGAGVLLILNLAACNGAMQQVAAVMRITQSERLRSMEFNRIYRVVFVPLDTTVNFH
jgi:hypothetical protein